MAGEHLPARESDEADWTRSASGIANMSSEYRRIVRVVQRMIMDDASNLLRGRSEQTARMIVSYLAHREHMAPRAWTLAHECSDWPNADRNE